MVQRRKNSQVFPPTHHLSSETSIRRDFWKFVKYKLSRRSKKILKNDRKNKNWRFNDRQTALAKMAETVSLCSLCLFECFSSKYNDSLSSTDNSAPRHGSQNGAVLHVPSKPLEIALVKFCLASTICDYTRNLRSILQCQQYLCRLDFECCFRIMYRKFWNSIFS